MSADTPSTVRDAELAQLRAELTEQRRLVEHLLAERLDRPAPRASARPRRTREAADSPRPDSRPTSRRGLLRRLGTSAAGAAVAATALGATRPTPAAADADATLAGASTGQYGVYASRNGIARPALAAGTQVGVLGITAGTANLAAIVGAPSGVAGAADDDIGVKGATNTGIGVAGVLGAGGPLASDDAVVAVLGTAATRVGVAGASTTMHGVFGQTNAAAGTVVSVSSANPGGGMLAAGLAGRTRSTIALYGYAEGPPNPNYAPVGAVGQCASGFGVWGLSSAGPGAASRPGGGAVTAVSGVLGASTSGIGMYALSSGPYALAADGNGPNTVGALIRGNGGGAAAVFVGNVQIQGHLTVTGGVNGPVSAAAATAPGDSRGTAPSLQAVQSPGALVEDLGRDN